jgi:fluoride ion exporter CrcB/FEX
METLTKYLAVAAGSAVGGMLRYFLGSTAILARTAAPCIIARDAANARAAAS